MECVFCKIVAGSIPSHKIWENEEFVAFLDINPVNPGHTLLIPKKHTDYFFDMDQATYSKIFEYTRHLSKSIKDAVNSKRIGLVVEGFLVPHAHLHIIPLNHGGEISFKNTRKVEGNELAEIANKIRQCISQS